MWCGEYFVSGAGDNGGGTCTWFNITLECGPNSGPTYSCNRIGTGQPGRTPAAIYEYNLHAIQNSGLLNYISPECVSACTLTVGNTATQSVSAAAAQGYTLAQTYSFSPTSAGGVTVGGGTNESALCTAISAIDAAAGTACLSDTTYGVTINSTTHMVTGLARTPVLRGSTWDLGAYQYTSAASTLGTIFSRGVTINRGVTFR